MFNATREFEKNLKKIASIHETAAIEQREIIKAACEMMFRLANAGYNAKDIIHFMENVSKEDLKK